MTTKWERDLIGSLINEFSQFSPLVVVQIEKTTADLYL